jgi:hypothetical protein
MINELNNNSIFAGNGKKKIQLPDSVLGKNDVGRIPGMYKNGDTIYTIYGSSGEFSSSSTNTIFSLLFYL